MVLDLGQHVWAGPALVGQFQGSAGRLDRLRDRASGELSVEDGIARALLDEDRGQPRVHDILGLVLYARKDIRGARESFERAVALDEGRAVYQNHLGFVLLELGDA
jgi:hypothetical protein